MFKQINTTLSVNEVCTLFNSVCEVGKTTK